MIDFVKKVLLRLYIKFFGVVFYRTELKHEFNHDDSLTIKHINNKEIKKDTICRTARQLSRP